MQDSDSFEPGDHVFTGTVKTWSKIYGELLTDSGVTVPLITQGVPLVQEGARVRIIARKLKPRFIIERIEKAE